MSHGLLEGGRAPLKLPPSPVRADVRRILQAALDAADPYAAVRRALSLKGHSLQTANCAYDLRRIRRVAVVGAGKAAIPMARAVSDVLRGRVESAFVVTAAAGNVGRKSGIEAAVAGHPIPDRRGLRAAQRILETALSLGSEDLLIVLLSGGASSLLPLPDEGLTLADKQRVTQALLRCGAKIQEINVVRKHLSGIKGGQAVRLAFPARVLSLILSDVIGDPLDIIASGPTAPDSSTFAQALEIISRYGIEKELPPNVLEHLRGGAAGRIPETPKPGDPLFDRVENLIIANNSASVEACAESARGLGYASLALSTTTEGEARDVARAQAALARQVLERGKPICAPACLISGGETTVTLRGQGRGGRNQEFALAAAMAIDGAPGIAFLAAGTDGTDGPTDAAGAFADGDTVRLAREKGVSAADCLEANDSYRFFDAVGGLVKTGPTGTNVMDLYLALVRPRG